MTFDCFFAPLDFDIFLMKHSPGMIPGETRCHRYHAFGPRPAVGLIVENHHFKWVNPLEIQFNGI